MTDLAQQVEEARKKARIDLEDTAHLYGERRLSGPLKRLIRLERAEAFWQGCGSSNPATTCRHYPTDCSVEVRAAIAAIMEKHYMTNDTTHWWEPPPRGERPHSELYWIERENEYMTNDTTKGPVYALLEEAMYRNAERPIVMGKARTIDQQIAELTRERDAARKQNIHGSEVRDILARQLDTANDQVHRLTQWLTSLFVPHDDCGHESGIHVAMCNAERLMRVQVEWNEPQRREQPTDTAEGGVDGARCEV